MQFGEMLQGVSMDKTVPQGIYLVKVLKLTEKHSQNGKLMYCPQYHIILPEECKGLMIFENFVFGSDTDPDALEPNTFKTSYGARSYKALCEKTGISVKNSDTAEQISEKLTGQEVLLNVDEGAQKTGAYKGKMQNQVLAYYTPGEREPKITGAVPTKSVKAVKKVVAPAPVDDEDDDDDEDDEDDD